MNLTVSILLTLLVILAALLFLAKVKSENLGSLFKWVGYVVLITALGLLICLFARSGLKLLQHKKGDKREYHQMHRGRNMNGNMMGKRGSRMMKNSNCRMGMKGSNCMMDGNCCDEMSSMEMSDMCGDSSMVTNESTIDTLDGKIIRKEMRIIKKKK